MARFFEYMQKRLAPVRTRIDSSTESGKEYRKLLKKYRMGASAEDVYMGLFRLRRKIEEQEERVLEMQVGLDMMKNDPRYLNFKELQNIESMI